MGRITYVGPWLFRGGKLHCPQTFIDPRGHALWLYGVGPVRWGMLLPWPMLSDPRGLALRLSLGQLELIPTLIY